MQDEAAQQRKRRVVEPLRRRAKAQQDRSALGLCEAGQRGAVYVPSRPRLAVHHPTPSTEDMSPEEHSKWAVADDVSYFVRAGQGRAGCCHAGRAEPVREGAGRQPCVAAAGGGGGHRAQVDLVHRLPHPEGHRTAIAQPQECAYLIAPCLLVPTSEQRPPLSRGGAVRGATAEGSWVATCTLGFTAEKVRDEHGVDVSVLHAIKGNPDG